MTTHRAERTLRGDSVTNYLEAATLLDALGPDPDADEHWVELGRAVGRTCTLCTYPAAVSGMCDAHYRRHRRGIDSQEAHVINRRKEKPVKRIKPRPIADVIEDIEDLLATGEHPARIAARVGTNPDALESRLKRAGRQDLISRLTVTAYRSAS